MFFLTSSAVSSLSMARELKLLTERKEIKEEKKKIKEREYQRNSIFIKSHQKLNFIKDPGYSIIPD